MEVLSTNHKGIFMEVISIDTYKMAKTLASAATALHGASVSTTKWYEFLSEIDNPRYDWRWSKEEV